MATQSDLSEADRTAPDQKSQIRVFWNNFRRNRLTIVGGILLVFILFVATAAPLLAPHDPTRQYQPGLESDHFNPVPPGTTFETANGEQASFMLGTDHLGRDILSRAMFGTRTLLISVLLIISLAAVLAIPIGAVSGYYGGSWIDETLMRLMDIVLAFPSLILAIALIGSVGREPIDLFTVFGTNVSLSNQLKIVFIVALVYTPRLARVMRSGTIKEVEELYVDAAKASGGGSVYILVKEVFPNALSPVIVQGTLYMGYAVLTVAGLSFLGIGILPPRSSLGMMLSHGRQYVYDGAWWFSVVPGLLIVTSILAFNILGDGLRDAFDPKFDERRAD